jgi:uncharacterized protein YbgA (DUF1722 family)/uncharacterized protein YbbK (DUF523 family)
MTENSRIKIGISTCLLGEKVRYDGGHKLDKFLRDTLGEYFQYVPVCPEFECGLGVPREAMRLEGNADSPRLVTVKTRTDLTDRMNNWAKKRVKELEKEELCGYIFKSKSPSSGMERVKVYNENGISFPNGRGLFARAFMDHFPLTPAEDEGRLHDPAIRENFIERIFALKQWRDMTGGKRRTGDLVKFHTINKYLLLSHNEKNYRIMGRMVAKAKDAPPDKIFQEYEQMLLETLRFKTTPSKNINVMQHMMGYFKKDLSSDEKQEILEMFGDYKKGNIPLIVPVTLIKHYVRKFREPYLAGQTFLDPHPFELGLRNHV